MYQWIPDSLWQKIKDAAEPYVRSFFSKQLTRWVGVGTTYLLATRWAELVPAADTRQQAVAWITTVAVAAVPILVDYLHHRADTK